MALVKAKVSSVVSRQVPEFVREDNAQFVAFLEAYYEFLEQTEKRNLESIRDIDDTVDDFIKYFRNELLSQVPVAALSDKRFLAKQIQDVYRAKGTVKSYEFLFKTLFNETPELYFPKVDMLRLSDGKWDQKVVIRTTEVSGDSFNLIGQTISQGSTRASVESVIKFQVGSDVIAELTINENSIIGTFNIDDIITGRDNINDSLITLNVVSVVTNFEILNDGAYYSIGSPIDLISGTGTDAQVEITNIGYGSVAAVIVDAPGSGYTAGTELSFDNTDAGEVGDSLISARAIITDIDLDSLLLEDGSKLLQENRSQFDIEDAVTGGIKSIELLTGGYYYRKLPIVTATGGTGAKLLAVGPEIGRVTKLGVTNPGVNYDTAPIAIFPSNAVVKNITGTFSIGDVITVLPQTLALEADSENELILETGDKIVLENQQSPSGTLYTYDTQRNLMTFYPATDRIVLVKEDDNGALLDEEGKFFVNESSGEFSMNQTITNTSGATARIICGCGTDNHAEARGVIGAVGRTLGKFLNADGKISESSKKIQDSLFYQEYSYVIKVGQSIDKYRDAVKKLLHPIGLALFGEVRIQTIVEAPTNITLEFSDLLTIIRMFLSMKMRAVGNYRTALETDPTKDKEQITLIITDFIATVLNITAAPSEFLPTLSFPNLSPTEIHLLDLRAELGESFKTIFWETFRQSIPQTPSTLKMELELSSTLTDGNRGLGGTLGWLEQWKFTIAPYAAGSKHSIQLYLNEWNQDYTGTNNEGYWDTYANTQIKDFANIIIGDVINNPNRRFNFTKEAFIDVIKLDTASPYTFDGSETMDITIATMDDDDTYGVTFDTVGSPTLDNTSVRMDTV